MVRLVRSKPEEYKLLKIGFEQSKVDECVFYRRSTIFIVYVDDGLVLDTNGNSLDDFVQELKDGRVSSRGPRRPLRLRGRHWTTSIIEAHANNSGKVLQSAACFCRLNSLPFEESHSFNYRSAVGKLNYLAQTTRPDTAAATHMIAKYSHNPKKE
ncbi:hypothetical protein THAOC_02392 [Thalassiosira oceanica]|uniref:Reverse transcriptase Ty1/copia-type domain-containing protein n=1 Tax=Thalassiosira oceanica TaxID=159749 RepID=K0TEP7_THAOC|nr:hypothetical protein THAOC_02392 [Thalassiosira oceanica]|eukprot:EJK75875.1 hypothetical protein THAOC_02392 [Thalassiosira oceanica]